MLRRVVKLVLVGVLPALLLGAGFAYGAGWRPAGKPGGAGSGVDVHAAPQRYGTAPTYTLRDQSGRKVASRELSGKVRVVSFLFPYCTEICPVVARDLAVTQHRLAAAGFGGRVKILTFNVDPKGAGPPQLRTFLRQYGATTDPATARVDWHYLTGPPQRVRRIITDGWGVSYRKIPDTQQNTSGQDTAAQHPNALAAAADVGYDVTHQERIYIVGPGGKILDGLDSSEATPKRLISAVRDAAGKLDSRSGP